MGIRISCLCPEGRWRPRWFAMPDLAPGAIRDLHDPNTAEDDEI
ncbi:hypothetical protein AB0F88_37110 [Streptosporangium sp. NPDC023963]